MVRVPGQAALTMLARFPFTADEIETAIDGVLDEMSPPAPTTGGPAEPPLPPIEHEHQPRRRKPSNLRYLDQHIHEDGVDWIERIAVARPGYRIKALRRRTRIGHNDQLWHIHTERIRRRRKANGKNGGTNAGL
jgi:hypothetical protein